MENCLYYGDNLDILRRYFEKESVDLIYLDPPFNSKATYNMLFKEHNGEQSAAQFQAFKDTWTWDHNAAMAFQHVVEAGGKPSQALQAFRNMLGDKNDMLAYLSMMAIRLIELHRVLKETGSIYLHCDPTASHYLKILMDSIFDVRNFRNEIIWRRSFAHGDAKQGAKQFGRCTDTILFYVKSDDATWNPMYEPYSEEALARDYKYQENGTNRVYRLAPVDGPGGEAKGNAYYEFLGVKGYWRFTKQNMQALYEKGRIVKSSTGKTLSQKMYLDEAKGRPVDNLWDDINRISPNSLERLGYETQKPEALLRRIILASSNKGDLVLDPFCGCGTAIVTAQKLGRNWVGIDITHVAINVMKQRLIDSFGTSSKPKILGEPTTLPDAQALAETDPYQFQWWALGLVGARPIVGKKGADKGIDGILYFHEFDGGPTRQVIFSVKAGNTNAAHVRDLHGVIDREKAEIGVLITMHEPTKAMRSEAASCGFYTPDKSNIYWQYKSFPKIQIITIQELLEGKTIDMPAVNQTNITYQRAAKAKKAPGNQVGLFGPLDPD